MCFRRQINWMVLADLVGFVVPFSFHPRTSSLPAECRASLFSSLFFFSPEMEFIFNCKCCREYILQCALLCSAHFRIQALPITQNKITSALAGNSQTLRQIPFTVSPIQCRLLSICILGKYVLEHKTYLEK